MQEPFGDVRASSALKLPSRARATMRLSRSVPMISTRALGSASRQTAAIGYASAPELPALQTFAAAARP